MASLTPQQKLCLDAIKTLTVDGVAPSYAELQAHLGLTSKSNVHRLIEGLVLRRHIRRIPGHARSLELVEPALDPYSVSGLDRLSSDSLRRVADRCHSILRGRSS